MNTSERLKIARQERKAAQREVREHYQIALEKELAHKAQLALRRETETLVQKKAREEFQRRQAIYCDCPEMDPDWRNLPKYCDREG
jgi:hypothetical protein